MRTIRLLLAFMTPLYLGAAGCVVDTEATIQDAQGNIIGSARVQNVRELLTRVTVEITGGTPGQHGVTIYTGTTCEGTNFSSVGTHFSPDPNQPHGTPGFPAHHAGDLGNIVLDENGNGRLVYQTNRITALPGPFNSVVGRAIVYHAEQDDLTTTTLNGQGDGNLLTRVGCGILQ